MQTPLVDGSGNANWYQQHPDVTMASIGVYYVLHGAEENRIPKLALEGSPD